LVPPAPPVSVDSIPGIRLRDFFGAWKKQAH
jgi:hypothetical protein